MTPNERLIHTGLLKQFEKSKKEDKAKILKWLNLDDISIKKFLESYNPHR